MRGCLRTGWGGVGVAQAEVRARQAGSLQGCVCMHRGGWGVRGSQACGGDRESYSDSNSRSQGSCRLPGALLLPGTVAARTPVYLDESVDRGLLQSLQAYVGLYTCRKSLKIHFFGFGQNYSDMFTHVCHGFNSFKKCAHFTDEV